MNNISKFLEEIKKISKSNRIYIFGAGQNGKLIRRILNSNKVKWYGYIDNNKNLYSQIIEEKKVYNLNLIENKEDIFIIVSISPSANNVIYEENITYFKQKGIKEDRIIKLSENYELMDFLYTYEINQLKQKNVVISYKCTLKNTICEEFVNIAHHAQIANSYIGKRSSIGRYSKVVNAIIGKYCSISWDVTIGALTHPIKHISSHAFPYRKQFGICKEDYNIPQKQTIIGNDVWIGCDVVIISGVKIGDGAIIGAGAVVTKDVPSYSVVGGVPAKILNYRFEKNLIERLINTKWWDFDDETLEKYQYLFKKDLDDKVLCELEEISKRI